jgi:hypothetical protein
MREELRMFVLERPVSVFINMFHKINALRITLSLADGRYYNIFETFGIVLCTQHCF